MYYISGNPEDLSTVKDLFNRNLGEDSPLTKRGGGIYSYYRPRVNKA